ncbi:hypothetical protein QC762_507840 [Podospora pseudocomata]|uniref:Mso1 N-terminal domain-containing protein n=3 Tax=Podospora TaxID=5144 RepID=A0ABR0H9V5_9PEZI|nr:hypothetical protein QC761_507840 [Podospora bellae-mahoneyi]KAK4653539.1 hypothetical protein QC762_507840 [Podospora pseudocomata]KAK4664810.1 hypothetical protein QC763_507840 [Podospora pseudopauciseta]
MGFIEKIQAKIELFRLEQRYTRRRHRRSTFVSNAIYVDGEYIYQSPNSTGSSSSTASSANTSRSNTTTISAQQAPVDDPVKAQKKLNRWSSMPGFGYNSKPDGMPRIESIAEAHDWRTKQQQQRSSFDR